MSERGASNGYTGDAPGDAIAEAMRSFSMLPAPDGLVEEIFDRTVVAARRTARRRLVALAAAAAIAITAAGAWIVTNGRADRLESDVRESTRTDELASPGEAPAATPEEEEELARLDDGVRRALALVAGTLAHAERIVVDQILVAEGFESRLRREGGHAASLLPLRASGPHSVQTESPIP